MGGFASSARQIAVEEALSQAKKERDIVRFVMPLFYTQEPLLPGEFEAAGNAWKMIVNNRCSYFMELKAQNPEMPYKVVSEYFFECLFTRLFDVHPTSRGLFYNSNSVGSKGPKHSFLMSFISMLLTQAGDPALFRKSLLGMTQLHNKLGVKAVEYSILGEVLLFTIKKCIGPVEYTTNVHFGWAKVYSLILDVIIPNVVHFELTHTQLVDRQFEKRSSRVTTDDSTRSVRPIVASTHASAMNL